MRKRHSSSSGNARWKAIVLLIFMCILTYFNYRFALSTTESSNGLSPSQPDGKSATGGGGGILLEQDNNASPPQEVDRNNDSPPPTPIPPIKPVVDQTSPPDTQVFNMSFDEALALYKANQLVPVQEDVKQPTKGFVDVAEHPDHGIVLPHDPSIVAIEEEWRACDARNAEFTVERDALCQQYLRNRNNMRSIKALSAILKRGRTIKFKIFYHHNNIAAIVKVSQNKFLFEPMSEYLAYALDRELNFTRTPTAAYVPLPVEYMQAASAIISPFFSQWFRTFVMDYDLTKRFFVPCEHGHREKHCSLVTIQLWMSDVHSALYSSLAVPYDYDPDFARKYYTPHGAKKWPPKPLRMRAVGDLNIRFIFDFLMGNTDRGMNDHNNFVYGGCDATTRCAPEAEEDRTKGIAKYAFIDHGSSFYSRKEPEENPFTGNITDVLICRYRRSVYDTFRRFLPKADAKTDAEKLPLVTAVKSKLPKNVFNIVSVHTFEQVQVRLEKVLKVIDACVVKYGEAEVFSLPEYWEV